MLLSSIRQYKVRGLLVLLVFVTTGTEYCVWKNGKGKQSGAIVSMVSTWMAADNEPPPPIKITPGTPKQGRTPLTASMLMGRAPEVQKQMLGERLAFLIRPSQPALTGKITVLLLELDNTALLHLLNTPAALQIKIQAAVQYLVDNDHQIPPNYSSQAVLNLNFGSRVKFYDAVSNNPQLIKRYHERKWASHVEESRRIGESF